MPPLSLILASTSPYRRQQLAQLGVPFECVAPEVDEERYQSAGLAPRELATTLARLKAEAVAKRYPKATVIGGDQLGVCDGRILGKPHTVARAIEQLTLLSGREHTLLTAICVVHGGVLHEHVEVTTLRMRTLTPSEIERYLAVDQPLDCAGSYKLECLGVALFEFIETADWTAITGLPLMALGRVLRQCGFAVP